MPRDAHYIPHSFDDRARGLCCGIAPDEFPSSRARGHARGSTYASGTPFTDLLLLGAAAAFKVGMLLGGSPHAFGLGLVCLLLSLASLLDARLRARPARVAAPALAAGAGDAACRGR